MLPVFLPGQHRQSCPYRINSAPIAPLKHLFLAQRYPPHRGAAARRLGMHAAALARDGEVFVIRRAGAGEEMTAEPRVYPIVARDLRAAVGAENALPGARKRGMLRHLLPLRQAFPFVLLSDDGGPDYRKKAFALAEKLIGEHGITHLYSSFRPWSDLLVARRLKLKYPQLHWTADFRDLPVDAVRQDIWWPALQTWWGKRVIAPADEVTCVSAGQRAQLAGWHPRIRVERNKLLRLPAARPGPVSERFTIVYTGSLYVGLQRLAPLVAALGRLLERGTVLPEKLCLRYRGKDAELFRSQTAALPAQCLDVRTSIAPAAAQTMQEEATVLLLLSWSAENYYGVLTAKLWDYLASGRPVLALVNGPQDHELTEIIEGAAAGAVFGGKDTAELEAWLEKAYLAWRTEGRLDWSSDRDELRQYL